MIPLKVSVVAYNLLGRTRFGEKTIESMKWLSRYLDEINYPLPPEYYISGTAFIVLLALVVLTPILTVFHAIFFNFPLFISFSLGTILAVIVSLIILAIFVYYPVFKSKSIKTSVEAHMPYTLLIMTSLAASGFSVYSTIEKAYHLIRNPDVKRSLSRIIRMTTEGIDISESLFRESLTTSSHSLSTVYEGLASLSQSGIGVMGFLEKLLHENIQDLESKLRETVEKLSVLMETYVIIALVFPLLTMIAVLFLGSFGGLPLPANVLMIMIAFVVIPLIFIILLLMADSIISEVKL
jgi:archaellum biogenesis protein FlaJ (TadC family)